MRRRVNVREICRFGYAQQDIPENAVVPEHILIFQIGPVAPAADDAQQLVLSRLQLPGQIELRDIVRALGIADKFPVQVQIQTACHTQKGDHIVLLRGVNPDFLPVHAREVVFLSGVLIARGDGLIHANPGKDFSGLFRGGNHGRFIGELIADVHIERPVIAPELPAGGHVDAVKCALVRVQRVGQLHRAGIEAEIPRPVQAEDLFGLIAFLLRGSRVRGFPCGIRDEVAAPRQLVLFKRAKGAVIGFVQPVPH